MAPPPTGLPSPEEIEAKRAARALKKAAAQAASTANGLQIKTESLGFIKREMVPVSEVEGGRKIKLMTWNILAQCLVRRELFPGSDCLKAKDRLPVLMRQVIEYDPDVACLQEVDRLSDHGPQLTSAGYDYTHVIGGYEDEGKQHGLLIAWKRSKLSKISESVLRMDELEPYPGRLALSRSTRNVALLCALRWNDSPAEGTGGLIVGTQHLFWHARYTYERARQAGLLVRSTRAYRASIDPTWPTFLLGDFNIQPSEPAYRLLTNTPLSTPQRELLLNSRVVHSSVDVRNGCFEGEDGYKTMQGDEDRVFTNVREAREGDGLMDENEIMGLYGHGGDEGLVSLYGSWGGKMKGQEGNWFKDRPVEKGAKEKCEKLEGRSEELAVREEISSLCGQISPHYGGARSTTYFPSTLCK